MPLDSTTTPPAPPTDGPGAPPPPAGDMDSPAQASAEHHGFSSPPPSEALDAKTVLMLDSEIRAFLSAVLDQDVPSIAGEMAAEKGRIAGPVPEKLAALALTLQDLISKVGSPKQQRRFGPATPEDLQTNRAIRSLAVAFRLAAKDKELINAIRPALAQIAQQKSAAKPPMSAPAAQPPGTGPGAPMPKPMPPRPMSPLGRSMAGPPRA